MADDMVRATLGWVVVSFLIGPLVGRVLAWRRIEGGGR